MDEHRIGLKPILQKVWCFDKERPIAPVQHRYNWRYLVCFVHPASGRTIFHLATSVNLDLFAVELEAFAHAVGAGPKKQIVLVRGLRRLACQSQAPGARAPSFALPPSVLTRTPASGASVAPDQHGTDQPPFCHH